MRDRNEETPRVRRVYRSAAACMFCGLLFALFALLFLPDKDFSETEKRALAQFPQMTLEMLSNGKTEKALEAYVQDQMPFRNFWVGVCAYFGRAAGQNGTDGIYDAADGYLIHTPLEEKNSHLPLISSQSVAIEPSSFR